MSAGLQMIQCVCVFYGTLFVLQCCKNICLQPNMQFERLDTEKCGSLSVEDVFSYGLQPRHCAQIKFLSQSLKYPTVIFQAEAS